MIRVKRSDTLVSTVERQHRITLNTRSDALLGNLLRDRGFDSVTQLVDACKWKAEWHARRRRVFVSFHIEDAQHLTRLMKMAQNPRLELDIYNASVREPIRSKKGTYVRGRIAAKINRASVLICLVGDGTGWRDWVEWEIKKAHSLRKGVFGVRIPGTFGRRPRSIVDGQVPVVQWDHRRLVAAIEWAAATRS